MLGHFFINFNTLEMFKIKNYAFGLKIRTVTLVLLINNFYLLTAIPN